MCPNHSSTNQFLELSAHFTGFTVAELQGTGLTDTYFETVSSIINSKILGELLSTFEDSDNKSQQLLTDPKLGPVIKNAITLWYLGQWNQMPAEWRNNYGASALDRDHIVSAESYKQGLAWQAMGAHAMGTKQQGFGAWSLAPPESS